MKQLFKETILNLLLATGIFALVVIFLYICGLVVNEDGTLQDSLLPLEMIAGIIGSAYVLIVRNPQNFLGFIVGIIMSILLGIQFYLQGMPEQTMLYYAVFIPCQIYTLIRWAKGSKEPKNSKYSKPSFLSVRGFLIGIGAFILIMMAVIFLLQRGEQTLATLMSAAVVASSTQANFLMIRKRTDAWIYWLIFSVTGIIQMICLANYVTLTLYVLYLFINGSACFAWCKQTDADRRGWLMAKSWKKGNWKYN